MKIVDDFLIAVEERRLADAAKLLAPDAEMIFPGGRHYRTLEELAEDSRDCYRFVGKHRDRYETAEDGTVVFSIGRLFGENNHGVRFGNVRYIDRFLLRDGLIVEQWVWNDLAHTGVLTARSEDELAPEWRP